MQAQLHRPAPMDPAAPLAAAAAAPQPPTLSLLQLPEEHLALISRFLVQQDRLNAVSNTARDISAVALTCRCLSGG